MNLKSIKTKPEEWVNIHKQDILWGLVIFLACLLSFGAGYLLAKYEKKEPLRFEGFQETRVQAAGFSWS